MDKNIIHKFRNIYVPIYNVVMPYASVYRYWSKKFIKTAPVFSEIKLSDSSDSLYTVVAFNDEKVIEKQIQSLNHFVDEKFDYMVFDNSTNDEKAKKIYAVCKEYNVSYLRLPENPTHSSRFFGRVSQSHALCINYIFYNFVKNSNYKNWIMLDHDIFPIIRFNSCNLLNGQNYNGKYVEKKKKRSYIWPGFCFMNVEWAKNKKIDFSVDNRHGCDTGARNAKFFNDENATFVSVMDSRVGENNLWGDRFEVFSCGWIHCRNASNYVKAERSDQKLASVMEIVDFALERKEPITEERFCECYMKKVITEVV